MVKDLEKPVIREKKNMLVHFSKGLKVGFLYSIKTILRHLKIVNPWFRRSLTMINCVTDQMTKIYFLQTETTHFLYFIFYFFNFYLLFFKFLFHFTIHLHYLQCYSYLQYNMDTTYKLQLLIIQYQHYLQYYGY